MAGPATKVATIGVDSRGFGRRALAIYLSTIVGFPLVLAWAFEEMIGDAAWRRRPPEGSLGLQQEVATEDAEDRTGAGAGHDLQDDAHHRVAAERDETCGELE